jgi:DNA helicase IV
MAGTDELDREQAHIRYSYECLDMMRARTKELLAGAPQNDPDLLFSLQRRIAQLTDSGRPLVFGRIDTEAGESWHVGRRHVEDSNADPVVVEWRAPVAEPFYRATVNEPLGLKRRRQLVADGHELLSMADDLFGDAATDDEASGPRVRGRDALLAELERARTGQMLDIVATIQAEQDEVIRAPMAGVLAVQGGPGTGKTAIGLHRAAFLLFGNDALARSGVLVIGPNRTFLRYIAQVLPSLGESAVVQTTLPDLVPDAPVRAVDSVEALRVKGDRRMVDVLRRALVSRRRVLEDDIEIRVGVRTLRLAAAEANRLAGVVAERRVPYMAGRTALRDLLVRAISDEGTTADVRVLQTAPGIRSALDVLWPAVSAAALVRELLTSRDRLASVADDVLTPDEQRAIVRKRARRMEDEAWTDGDYPLVDEALDLLEGRSRTYGHVVVDEAQDLSPMQVRMLGRRCPSGSFTVLGDLAQGIGVWARDSWQELVADLPQPDGARFAELTLGYRAPGQVLDLASRLLPEIAPHLTPTQSIRAGRRAPTMRAAADLPTAAADEAAALAAEGWMVGVIAPAALVEPVRAALADRGADVGEVERTGLARRITVMNGLASKGLEFDAVVVVEPAEIAAEAQRGLRLVYVTLTRPTQHLSIVHTRPLPDALLAAA